MPMRDVEFGVRITADNQVFLNGVKASGEALKGFKDQIGGASDATNKARGAQENLTGSIFKGVGAVEILRRAWDVLVSTFVEVRDATLEMQRGQAALEGVLRATSGAAGQTSDSINALVDSLAKVTRFTDTELKRAATGMLTFSEVSGRGFERILKLSADLASTGRGDVEQWSVVLSKVAQAPLESIGLLERQLGKFSSTLKVAVADAVYFGDSQKALNLILDEVTRRVGGTAVQSYRGLEKQLDGTTKAWTKLKEAVGEEIFNAGSKNASIFEQALIGITGKVHSFAEELKRLPGLLAPLSFMAKLIETAQIATRASERNNRASGQITQFVPIDTQLPIDNKGGLLTLAQRQALREQDLQSHSSYLAKLFQAEQNEDQRELDILESSRQLGLVIEEDYFRRKAEIQSRGARTAVDYIDAEIEEQRKLLALAQGQLSAARNRTGDTNQSADIATAEGKILAAKARIRDLTKDQEEAEKKVGDAVRKTGDELAIAVQKRQDTLAAISRDGDDYQRTLTLQTREMQAQLELTGADELAVRLANNERKISVDLETRLLALRVKIQELLSHGKDFDDAEVQGLLAEMEQVKGAAAQAIQDQAGLIRQTYNQEFFASFSHDLADALITGGRDASTRIRAILEAALKKPFVIALQGLIQQGANALFQGAVNAVGGQLLGGSGTSLLGTGASSLFGEGVGTGFGYGGSGFWGTEIGMTTAETIGQGGAALASALGAGAEAASAFGQAVIAAVPVVGWIVAAAAIAYSIWGHPGGGDKQQGSFAGTFDPTGHLASTGNPDLSGITGDNQNPAAAQAISQNIAMGYAQAARALGLTPQQLTIASGFSTDPAGTAPSIVHTHVLNAQGQDILNMHNENVDRTPDALNAEIRRESEAAIVAALRASMGDMPAAMQDILRDVDPATASLQQLDDALKKLFEMKAVLDGLAQLNLHGLDITALENWQRSGESLTATFQRVSQQWGFFEQNFLTTSQQVAIGQHAITAAFTDLGITAPTTVAGFASLVQGLDLSTESGRHMWDVLMGIAPQFLAVANAGDQARQQMEQLTQSFYQAATAVHGGAGSAFGQSIARMNLESAAQRWLDLAGTDHGQQTIQSVIANVPTVDPTAARAFALGLGPDGLTAITELFSAYAMWQSALTSGAPALSNFTTQLTQTSDAFAAARSNLGDWLRGLSVDPNLSPLSPDERLALAGSDWQSAVNRANAGDATAAGKVQGLTQTYLGIAEQLYAHSPQFVDIFNRVYSADAQVAGMPDLNSRLSSVLPMHGELFTGRDAQNLGDTIGAYFSALSSGNAAMIEGVRADLQAILRRLDALAEVGRR